MLLKSSAKKEGRTDLVNFDLLNGSISFIKELRGVLASKEKLEGSELRVKLADVSSNLSELKMQVTDLQEENFKLKKEIEGKDKMAELRRAFTLHEQEGSYVLAEEILGYKPGYYCPVCFEKDKNVIPLGLYLGMGAPIGHQCNVCDSKYVNVDKNRFGSPFSQGTLSR